MLGHTAKLGMLAGIAAGRKVAVSQVHDHDDKYRHQQGLEEEIDEIVDELDDGTGSAVIAIARYQARSLRLGGLYRNEGQGYPPSGKLTE